LDRRRGRKRWWKKATAHREALVSKPWNALMRAELVFALAQIDVASVPVTGPADLHAMADCSVTYDRVELARGNRAPIAIMVADEIFKRGSAVQS
jgi:hypothetical protein